MPLFLEAIKETSVSCKCDPNEILMGLLDESCDRISLVVQPERRKIIGMDYYLFKRDEFYVGICLFILLLLQDWD